jgi:hypothetical protein
VFDQGVSETVENQRPWGGLKTDHMNGLYLTSGLANDEGDVGHLMISTSAAGSLSESATVPTLMTSFTSEVFDSFTVDPRTAFLRHRIP